MSAKRNMNSVSLDEKEQDNNIVDGEYATNFQSSAAEYCSHWSDVISSAVTAILKKLNPSSVEESPVLSFLHPVEMMDKFDLFLPEESNLDRDLKGFTDLCQQIIDHSVKTSHPLYLNYLYGGTDAYGLAAAFLIEALNTNTHTYDAAPLLSLIELEVVRKLCELCGFPTGGEGISCPGGSIANMYGLNLARFNQNKDVKEHGVYGEKRHLIFTSNEVHYSAVKAVSFMGLGSDSLVYIDCDSNGAMDPIDLEEKILMSQATENVIPLMVWCTSGTTVLNAFDPLFQISQLCQKHKLWMHVDGLLAEAHKSSASYLFHAQKHYDTRYDWGDLSIQCGRKADALKIWLMWKARGLKGLEARINETCQVAQYMTKCLGSHPRFRLVIPECQGTSVCFWVVPPRISKNYGRDSKAYWNELDGVAIKLKSRMTRKGIAQITHQPLPDKGLVNFFRCTLTCHPPFTRRKVDQLIDILTELSDDL